MNTYSTMRARRDADFVRCLRRTLEEHAHEQPTVKPLMLLTLRKPAPQYYVSYGYALRVLRERRSGLRSRYKERSTEHMWQTIEKAVARLRERHNLSVGEALQRVLTEGRAPAFFIAPTTAQRIYQESLAIHSRNSRSSQQTINLNTPVK